VTRPVLSLYRLDRTKLSEVSGRLRRVLAEDDKAGFSSLLGLGEELAQRVGAARWSVDLMLRPDTDALAGPLFASLRRIAKRAALEQVWKSESPSLEGRLRAYDVIRDEPEVAALLDRLLDSASLPWFLQRPGATGGWLEDRQRTLLATGLEAMGPALPDEVNAFVEALGGMDGDALVHDKL
jgi:hypothetical protein